MRTIDPTRGGESGEDRIIFCYHGILIQSGESTGVTKRALTSDGKAAWEQGEKIHFFCNLRLSDKPDTPFEPKTVLFLLTMVLSLFCCECEKNSHAVHCSFAGKIFPK
jgi:hypothetical protein